MKANGSKKKRMRLASFLLMLVCLLFLSGCWDAREIEKRAAVAALAIDKAENGGLIVTAQVAIPLEIAGGGEDSSGGGGGSPVKLFSSQGRTFREALQNLQYEVSGKLYFGHTTIIAFGKEVAKDGIQNIIDPLRRMELIRRQLYPFVVQEGKARDLLKVKTDLEKLPATAIKDMIDNDVRLGTLSDWTLGKFYIALSNTAKQPMMITLNVNKEKNISVTGLGVYKSDHLVGFLDRRETAQLLQIAKGEDGGILTAQADKKGHLVTFQQHLVNTKYDFSYDNGIVHTDVNVYLEGGVQDVPYQVNLASTADRKRIEKGIKDTLDKDAAKMVHKLQSRARSDVLDLGARLRAYHNDIWQQVDWDEAFPKADIQVHYHVSIRRAGMKHR